MRAIVRDTYGSPNVLELPHQALGFRVQAYGVTQHKDLSSRRLAHQDAMPIPPWRMVGLTTSQSSRSRFRQKNCARATNLTLGFTKNIGWSVFCAYNCFHGYSFTRRFDFPLLKKMSR